jgi:ABC-type sugar transport system permease subunit
MRKTIGRTFGRQNGVAYAFIALPLLVYIGFVLVPVVQSFLYSFTDWKGFGPIKRIVWFSNYVELFTKDRYFLISMRNNALLALCAATLPIAAGLLFANMLSHGFIRGTKVIQVIYFMPQIISMFAAALVWKWIFDPILGPINQTFSLLGLKAMAKIGWLGDPVAVMPSLFAIYFWKNFGFPTVVFIAAMQGIDFQLYDSALIDGCNAVQRFLYITIPSIRRQITTVMLLMIIWSFNTFDIIMATTKGGPGYSSFVMSYLVYFEGVPNSRTGYAGTISTVLCVILLLFSKAFMNLREKE